MGKISPVSAKYIIHVSIEIEGTVDKPDIIGAVFGQTEGLLGSDLELRELQKSGRVGRIEVSTEVHGGKTEGGITIPSSLDKTETVIVAAALETIQRIGPCNAHVKVEKIEDVRISKRNFVIQRAKELLKVFTDQVLPDSQELTEEVEKSVRVMEIQEYGPDHLAAGPTIEESEEIILVEGRADVLNLLKNGFKNVIALNGTSVPESIKPLCAKKTVTLFVDGDRGGDLIIREAMEIAEIDFVVKAPDGKEVEELAKKEIHKALRSRITAEQAKLEIKEVTTTRPTMIRRDNGDSRAQMRPPMQARPQQQPRPITTMPVQRVPISEEQQRAFKQLLEDLVGTRAAYVLDDSHNVLGKVPVAEIPNTLRSMKGISTIIFDGVVSRDFAQIAERSGVKLLVGMDARLRPMDTKIQVLTTATL